MPTNPPSPLGNPEGDEVINPKDYPDWFTPGASPDEELLLNSPGYVPEIPNAPIEAPEDESRGWLADTLLSVPVGLLRGVDNAVSFFIADSVPGLRTEVDESGAYTAPNTPFQTDRLPDPETLVGGLTGGISQFLGGSFVGGAVLGNLRRAHAPWIQKTRLGSAATNRLNLIRQNMSPKALWAAKSMTSGAVGDFLAFGPGEQRLSDLAADLDIAIVSDVADYLRSDKQDGQIEGRLKNTLEGMLLGPLVDGVLAGLRRGFIKIKSGDAKTVNEGYRDIANGLESVREATASDPAPRGIQVRSDLNQIIGQVEVADGVASIWETFATRVLRMDPDEAWANKVTVNDQMTRQGPRGSRGSITFTEDGQAILDLYKGANAKTIIHEMGHMARRWIDGPNKDILFRHYAPDGRWTRKAEEAFARDWESYIYNGHGPTKEVAGIFRRFKEFFAGVTRKLISRAGRIDPEVRRVLSDVLGGDQGISPIGLKGLDEVTGLPREVQTDPVIRDALSDPVVRHTGENMVTGREIRGNLENAHNSVQEALQTSGKVRGDLINKIIDGIRTVDPTEVDVDAYLNSYRNAISNESPEIVRVVNEAVGRVLEPTLARNKALTNEMVRKLAGELGGDADTLKRYSGLLEALTGNQKDILGALVALRNTRVSLMGMMKEFATKLRNRQTIPPEMEARGIQLLAEFVRVDTLVKDTGTFFGRGLQAHRIVAESYGDEFAKALSDGTADLSRIRLPVGNQDDIRTLFETVLTQADDEATRFIRRHIDGRLKSTSLWTQLMYGALLGGPKTQFVNASGNNLNAILVPIERAMGASLRGDFREAHLALQQLIGTFMATKAGLSAGWDVLRHFDGVGARTFRGEGGTTKLDLPINRTDPNGSTWRRLVSNVMSMPFRLMSASDTMTSRMVQQGYIYSKLLKEGIRDPQEITDRMFRLNDRVSDKILKERDIIIRLLSDAYYEGRLTLEEGREYIDSLNSIQTGEALLLQEGGLSISPDVIANLRKFEGSPEAQRALDNLESFSVEVNDLQAALKDIDDFDDLFENADWFARESNYTRKLDIDAHLKKVQELQQKSWAFRMILPFIKTPANIINVFTQHIPGIGLFLAYLHKATRKQFFETLPEVKTADGRTKFDVRGAARTERFDVLLGRQIMGVVTALSVWGLWEAGRITGFGPKDPEERAAWYAAGNQPNAIRVGDQWISLSRMAPFGPLIGTIVEVFEGAESGTAEGLVEHLMDGFREGVFDQSFFVGLTNVTDAIERGSVASYGVNLAASMGIPLSSFWKQTTDAITGGTIYRNDGGLQTQIQNLLASRSLGLLEGTPRYDLEGNVVRKGTWVNALLFDTSEMSQDPATIELAKVDGGIKIDSPGTLFGAPLKELDQNRAVKLKAELQRTMVTIKLGGNTLQDTLNKVVQSDGYRSLPGLDEYPEGTSNAHSHRAKILKRIVEVYQRAAEAKYISENPEVLQELQQPALFQTLLRRGAAPEQLEQFQPD